MGIGDSIRKLRTARKLSQEYLAVQLGISRQAVSKWENGQTEPTAPNLVELARIFEISISKLVELENMSRILCYDSPEIVLSAWFLAIFDKFRPRFLHVPVIE